MPEAPRTVDEYLSLLPEDRRHALEEIRAVRAAGNAIPAQLLTRGEGPVDDRVTDAPEHVVDHPVHQLAAGQPVAAPQEPQPIEEAAYLLYDATPVLWKDVPAAYPEYVQIGYGAIDKQSRRRASAVLSGSKEMPDRSETDEYFELDGEARRARHEVFSRP